MVAFIVLLVLVLLMPLVGCAMCWRCNDVTVVRLRMPSLEIHRGRDWRPPPERTKESRHD